VGSEWEFSPVLAVLLLVTVLPGLALAVAVGLRGWLLAAATPLLTYGLIGAAGSALPLVGLIWSPISFAAATLTLAAIGGLFRWLSARRARADAPPEPAPGWSLPHHVGITVAVLVSGIVSLSVTVAATRGFTAVPQVWDSVFHSNAIAYITGTGHSDPAALQNLNEPTTETYYYPNAYHVLAATVLMLTGTDVPTVVDAGVALVPAVLAIGAVALVRHCGGRPAFAAAAALLSCAFTAFPWDLLPWGTLLPLVMAIALLPAFLALWVASLERTAGGRLGGSVAFGLGGIGLLALHPSAAVAAAVFGIGFLVQLWIHRKPRPADFAAIGTGVLTALVLGAPLLLASVVAASGPAFDWPATMRPADAVGQLFFLSHEQPFPQYWLVALAAVGIFRARAVRPFIWLVAVGVLFAGLFVMAAAYEGDLVAALTRPWWNDKWRFAALWSLAALFLAAAGVVEIRDGLWALGRRVTARRPGLRGGRRRLAASAALLGLVLIGVAALTNGLYHDRNETRLAQAFTDGPTVSELERRAFDQLATLVPDSSMVMNDPYDGSALMWALSGVRPVFASPVIALQELPTMDPERRLLFAAFNELDDNVLVQRAVQELDIQYAIICTGFIAPAGDHVPGMQNLEQVRSLRPVFENADAKIYEIVEAADPSRG
jgi:hypothetical protein